MIIRIDNAIITHALTLIDIIANFRKKKGLIIKLEQLIRKEINLKIKSNLHLGLNYGFDNCSQIHFKWLTTTQI